MSLSLSAFRGIGHTHERHFISSTAECYDMSNELTHPFTCTGEGDSLRWARICRPTEEVLVATRDGFGECPPSST